MKKQVAALLAACLYFFCACGSPAHIPPPTGQQLTEGSGEVYEQAAYSFAPLAAAESFTAGDGSGELARYDYQLLTLSAANLDSLSPIEKGVAERNIESFNKRMEALLADSVALGSQIGADALRAHEQGSAAYPYYDETQASAYLAGQIISVRLDNGSFTGGAHPNSYTSSLLFDLGSGQFIDPAQIAESPESFRTGAAELLLAQAEALDVREFFFPEYAETIAHWNEGTVLFDEEGMEVFFSCFELGPYAMGPVALRLDYAQLADLVGENGLTRLGRTLLNPTEQ